MGRPRDYDPDALLDRIGALFAEHGYGGTSIETLVEATGVGRQSLYHGFGSKRGLARAAARRAARRIVTRASELAREDPGLAGVQEVLNERIRELAGDPPRRSCPLLALTLEIGPGDVRVDRTLRQAYRRLTDIFDRKLQQAVEMEEVDPDIETRAVAHQLVAVWAGLGVLARAGAARRILDRSARIAVDLLAAT